MKKFAIKYYRCPNCGFVQTEEPYWLKEAYSRPINISDTGIMVRNIQNAVVVNALIKLCFNRKGKFVDYGGGYGIFVRMMRDRSFDFYCDDKFCDNLFAHGFDVIDSGENRFELLTAFEVFEHFLSPHKELNKLLQYSDNIYFTTEIVGANPPQPNEWWYYGLDHGQHISIYTTKSLQLLADKHGLNYYYRGNKHLLTKNKLNCKIKFRLVSYYRISRLIDIINI